MTDNTAILYLRFSPKPDADECDTLERQQEELEAYCRLHQLEPAYIIRDPEISGGDNLAERPGGQQLLTLIESGAASHVVFQRVDRLSRKARDGLTYVEDWCDDGIHIHFARQGGASFDASTSLGWLILYILLGFATFERLMIRERTRDKMRSNKRNRVKYCRTPPFGFRWEGNTMVEVPAEQSALEHIKFMHKAGCRPIEMADWLNSQHFDRRSNNWDCTAVRKQLINLGLVAAPKKRR